MGQEDLSLGCAILKVGREETIIATRLSAIEMLFDDGQHDR